MPRAWEAGGVYGLVSVCGKCPVMHAKLRFGSACWAAQGLRREVMRVGFCLISLFLTVGRVSSLSYNDLPTLDAVLDQYEATCERRRSCYIRSETFLEFSSSLSAQVDRSLARSELYRNGSLVDLYIDNFRPVSSTSDPNVPAFLRQSQILWNGNSRYDIHNGDPSWVFLRGRNHGSGESILEREYPGHVLEGFFLGDEESILTILRDQPPTATRVYNTTLDECLCRVIETNIVGRGTYKVWFDPAHGYNICRAQVTRTAADTFLTKPVSQAFGPGPRISSIEFLLYDVTFQRSFDAWFPVSGKWRLTRIYENGENKTSIISHRCLEIECGNSDLRFAEAFVPHVRDGTVVYTAGKSSLLREEWMNGRPEPVVDWRLIRTTDEVVDQHIRNLEERGAVISLIDASSAPCDPNVASDEVEMREHFIEDDQIETKTRMYCGLYCVYAAVRASGERVGFTEFLKTEYLASVRGSSVFGLRAAARDHGLYAEPVEKLTVADLKASPYCCILHVKAKFESPTYSHYVLFLGMEGDDAVLYDAGHLRRVPLSDVAPLWRGSGLVLASQPIDVARLVAPGRVRFIVFSVAALCMVGLVHWAKRSFVVSCWCLRRSRLCLSVSQAMALGVIALLASLANHLLLETGMVANRKASTSVREAHSGDFVPRIGLARTQSLLAEGAIFVDSRFRRNYEAGCIPGAISIPVDANESQYKNMIVRIPRNSPVVVYCQSAKCGFAGTMAARLARDGDGFEKVSIFRGGWYEWVTSKDRKTNENRDALGPRASGQEGVLRARYRQR